MLLTFWGILQLVYNVHIHGVEADLQQWVCSKLHTQASAVSMSDENFPMIIAVSCSINVLGEIAVLVCSWSNRSFKSTVFFLNKLFCKSPLFFSLMLCSKLGYFTVKLRHMSLHTAQCKHYILLFVKWLCRSRLNWLGKNCTTLFIFSSILQIEREVALLIFLDRKLISLVADWATNLTRHMLFICSDGV